MNPILADIAVAAEALARRVQAAGDADLHPDRIRQAMVAGSMRSQPAVLTPHLEQVASSLAAIAVVTALGLSSCAGPGGGEDAEVVLAPSLSIRLGMSVLDRGAAARETIAGLLVTGLLVAGFSLWGWGDGDEAELLVDDLAAGDSLALWRGAAV
jgi:hypothetical protein